MRSTFEGDTFINDLGQRIEPGEEVLIITTGYGHNVNVRKGTYGGRRGNQVSCYAIEEATEHYHKSTGKKAGYGYYRELYSVSWNNPDRARLQQEIKDRYFEVKVPKVRRTTLQRNRIYKLA